MTPIVEDKDATPEQLHDRCDEDYAAGKTAREQDSNRK